MTRGSAMKSGRKSRQGKESFQDQRKKRTLYWHQLKKETDAMIKNAKEEF